MKPPLTPALCVRAVHPLYTAQLRHSGQCMALIALALEEAQSVNTPLPAAGLLHLQVGGEYMVEGWPETIDLR